MKLWPPIITVHLKQSMFIIRNKTILFLILSILTQNSFSQIGFAFATDKESGNSIEWKIEWGYGSQYDAENHAFKYLIEKGYHPENVYYRAIGEYNSKISSGYWVVVKADYTPTDYGSDKKQRVRYGVGSSSESYENAEIMAVKNLEVNDWIWKKSYGYSIDKKGMFDEKPQYQIIFIIKSKKTPCGQNAVDFSHMLGNFENKMYNKIYQGLKQTNPDKDITLVSHIIRNKGLFGVLKCIKQCDDGTKIASYKVVEAETEEELTKIAPYPKGSVSQAGETMYFIETIINVSNKETASIWKSTLEEIQKVFVEKYQNYHNIITKITAGGIRD